MQPFDALTIRAVLAEAKPLLLNHKVDKIYQLGRDEIVLSMRSKSGMVNLLMSAQMAYGRLCLVKLPSGQQPNEKGGGRNQGGNSPSNFAMLLKRHLTGATLIAVEQPLGERMVDFAFSCIDEVGGTSLKVLTVEIMGRHSNLIFWDKQSEKIVCASHIVTKEMSRQREVAPGLKFERPPGQDKLNIFAINEEEFSQAFQLLRTASEIGEQTAPGVAPTLEQWLLNTFTGLGRHLAGELIASTGSESAAEAALRNPDLKDKLWQQIERLQKTSQYKPAMKVDLSTYTVLSWWPGMEGSESWRSFPAVNDLIEEYFRLAEAREQFVQLRERLRAELKGESERLESRIAAASQHMGVGETLEQLKRYGDLVLANMATISSGQAELVCEDMFGQTNASVTIKLNPNITASQNAQTFYRQFAKSRARKNAATIACGEATKRLEYVRNQLTTVEGATDANQLKPIKELLIGRKPQDLTKREAQQPAKKKNKSRLLSTTSSDGWTIYVGRNRQENDYLLTKLALPHDLWLHIQGQGGAHVLIRVPASKQDPPMNTIREAALIAAILSKAASGTKVRVVYTQCRFVKKIAREKPGVVRYEQERTLEVDTGAPMPKCVKLLFQQ